MATNWSLTRREFQVWALIASGLTNRGIAQRLDVGERNIEQFITSLYWKLGLSRDHGLNRRVAALMLFL